jgi:hypothetical protein
MNTEDKAKELFEIFLNKGLGLQGIAPSLQSINQAKQCALIAVDEIINVLGSAGVYGFADDKVAEYWEEVKEKIKQL